jgi:hypothetical protein
MMDCGACDHGNDDGDGNDGLMTTVAMMTATTTTTETIPETRRGSNHDARHCHY